MQPTQAINPFQQVLDNEAFEILTKCDPKLATAILSIALKKFSETKEFIYFVKPEFKNEFEERFSGLEEDISMISPDVSQSDQSTNNIQNAQNNQNIQNTQPETSAVTVAW